MARQAIEQAECEWCDDESASFDVTEKTTYDEGMGIEYSVMCSCGARGTITVDEDGTDASGGISHESASWNEDEEESDDAS